MNIREFAAFLAARVENYRLHISVPLYKYTLSNDNAEYIERAFNDIAESTPVFVRQFTNMASEEPYKTTPDKFLPIKRIAGFYVSPGPSEIVSLTADMVRSAYSTDADTGQSISLGKDLVFMDGDELLRIIEQGREVGLYVQR